VGEFADRPFALLDWQWRDVIGPLFGWKRRDGTRRFRRAYVEIPKKNGKSTLCAGIALYLLVADGEPGAEVYSAAADRRQASIVFNEAVRMVYASPHLARILEPRTASKRILHPGAQSFYEALSADVPTKEGLNIHGLIFDELHAQKTRKLWDTLGYGGAARRQPLLVAITTAGVDRDSICYEQHRYAEGVLNGTVEDWSYFAYIRGAGPEDDWADQEVWKQANPSWGVTIKPDTFAEDFKRAKNSVTEQNAFRRYRLNQWTEQEVRWISLDRWDACQATYTAEDLTGHACYGGLDLALTTDVAAFVLYFADTRTVLPYFWVPECAVKDRGDKNRFRLDPWVRSGRIHATPGNVIDYDHIRVKLNALRTIFDIREVAMDRWNSAQLATQLSGDGFKVFLFGQGYASMSGPAKELERLILDRKLQHDGNPVLRWMVSNVAIEQDAAGNIKPSKRKSAEKIDGVVALCMALGRAMVAAEKKGSVYDQQGLDYV
jgi:phage terminase large subunit-like protein